MIYLLNLIFSLRLVNATTQCTTQSDCALMNPNSNCIFLAPPTSNSPPHGICSEPITKISSFSAISATTPIPETSNSSCGNAAISFQCAFGQFCVDGSCTNAGDATKGFFTPAMIAIFAVAGIVLCLGSVLLCCLCKCCCFSGRMVDRGAKKVVAPIRQQPEIQQHEQTFPYGPSIPPSDIKDTFIIQKKQLSNPYDSPPLFHTEEKIEYIPANLPLIRPIQKDEHAEYYDQYERHLNRQPESNQYLVLAPFHKQKGSSFEQGPSKVYSREDAGINTSTDMYPYQDSLPLESKSPIFNHTTAKTISSGPHSGTGFWAFWDEKGRFHQGYTDSNGIIYGGFFDDLGYFHFGTVGEHEPILVEDLMLSGYQSQESGNGSIKIITQDHDALSKTRPNSVSAQRDDLLGILRESCRERGESMDVFLSDY